MEEEMILGLGSWKVISDLEKNEGWERISEQRKENDQRSGKSTIEKVIVVFCCINRVRKWGWESGGPAIKCTSKGLECHMTISWFFFWILEFLSKWVAWLNTLIKIILPSLRSRKTLWAQIITSYMIWASYLIFMPLYPCL